MNVDEAIRDFGDLRDFAKHSNIGDCKAGFFITNQKEIARKYPSGVLYLRQDGTVRVGAGLNPGAVNPGFWPNKFEARTALNALRRSLGMGAS